MPNLLSQKWILHCTAGVYLDRDQRTAHVNLAKGKSESLQIEKKIPAECSVVYHKVRRSSEELIQDKKAVRKVAGDIGASMWFVDWQENTVVVGLDKHKIKCEQTKRATPERAELLPGRYSIIEVEKSVSDKAKVISERVSLRGGSEKMLAAPLASPSTTYNGGWMLNYTKNGVGTNPPFSTLTCAVKLPNGELGWLTHAHGNRMGDEMWYVDDATGLMFVLGNITHLIHNSKEDYAFIKRTGGMHADNVLPPPSNRRAFGVGGMPTVGQSVYTHGIYAGFDAPIVADVNAETMDGSMKDMIATRQRTIGGDSGSPLLHTHYNVDYVSGCMKGGWRQASGIEYSFYCKLDHARARWNGLLLWNF